MQPASCYRRSYPVKHGYRGAIAMQCRSQISARCQIQIRHILLAFVEWYFDTSAVSFRSCLFISLMASTI